MRNTHTSKGAGFWLGLGLGSAIGYAAFQFAWVFRQLARRDIHQTLLQHVNQGQHWQAYSAVEETAAYTVHHVIEDGIERVSYIPKQRRFETPIVMQHGMFHGAWCWRHWQALFAEWGWVSHAHSLPGHAGSPTQRPIALCTLDYYLAFLRDEVLRYPYRPVVMGHSMGGALLQWYLKYVGDDLPAAVLVAPWEARRMVYGSALLRMLRLNPGFVPQAMLAWDAAPMANTPERAARAFLDANAMISPEAFYTKLGPESILVLLQHNPPFWYPPEHVQTPMLWLAGEQDFVLPEAVERRAAAHYQADYKPIAQAGHDIMLAPNYRDTASHIHEWLINQSIV